MTTQTFPHHYPGWSTRDEGAEEVLRQRLFGRSIVSARKFADGEERPKFGYSDRPEGQIVLDDGTILYVAGNEGGCSCGAGDYFLDAIVDIPVNGITNVEVQVEEKPDEYGYSEAKTYRIFVLTQGLSTPVQVASFDGDDGNGYYGTGFWVAVVEPPS